MNEVNDVNDGTVMKDTKKFEKVFVLDTNILLESADNLINISQDGKNLIVLPETVLDELDNKKTGWEEINFQARSFGRLLSDAEVIKTTKVGSSKDVTVMRVKVKECIIDIISMKNYNLDNVERAILNDRKIIKIAQISTNLYKGINTVFLSNDIMARTRAISLGVKTEGLKANDLDIQDVDFHSKFESETFSGLIKDIPDVEHFVSSVEILNTITGKAYYFAKYNNSWVELQDKNSDKFCVPPKNLKQKVMSQLITTGNDIIVCDGPAGTGKNLIATAAAMRLIDTQKNLYHKIYYIRRTVISGDKSDELGFLPGTLSEKLSVYNYPMKDTLKKIVKMRLKKDELNNLELIEEKIQELETKYQVEYLYSGHLRGSTLDEGSILICDETQNWDIKSIRTIFSRMGKDSIIIALGSVNQIDTPYLSKNNNALTFLKKKCGKDYSIKIEGVTLDNVIRSKIAEFADDELI